MAARWDRILHIQQFQSLDREKSKTFPYSKNSWIRKLEWDIYAFMKSLEGYRTMEQTQRERI